MKRLRDACFNSLPRIGGGRRQSVLSRLILAVLLGALALAPAACGRKGPPQLPPGETDQIQHRYPQSTDPQEGVFH
jgi:predicted small lipoprotein YifL